MKKSWIDAYKHLILDDDMIKMYHEEYIKEYSGTLDEFKAIYFQTMVDINFNVLKAGDEVYYVFGKSLSKGIIDYIVPFKIGYTYNPRIRIKGKKNLVWAHQTAKINN